MCLSLRERCAFGFHRKSRSGSVCKKPPQGAKSPDGFAALIYGLKFRTLQAQARTLQTDPVPQVEMYHRFGDTGVMTDPAVLAINRPTTIGDSSREILQLSERSQSHVCGVAPTYALDHSCRDPLSAFRRTLVCGSGPKLFSSGSQFSILAS